MEEFLPNNPPAANPSLAKHLSSSYRIPWLAKAENILCSFSPFERALLYGFSTILGASVFALLVMLNVNLTNIVPSHGGSLTEGIVGTPRFINPLLAVSEADRDVTALVYSGLMRATPDNTIIPDLAQDVQISDDGTVYTFTIRDNALFQDGTPVSASDIIFTIAMAQNPDIKSPRRTDWEGVVAEEVSDKIIRATLPHPYAPFLESATLGILPRHLWQNVSISEFPFDELNAHPVGSGPYSVNKISFNSSGTPERYTLKSFSDFTLGEPFLRTIIFNFYPNEDSLLDALKSENIESAAGITPDQIKDTPGTIMREPLPRIFAVFFNQSKAPIFADATVREALAEALDKKAIIDDNLGGYGVPLDSPILDKKLLQKPIIEADYKDLISESEAVLEKGGWVLGDDGIRAKKSTRLAFSIATADTVELAGTADSVARTWRALGADVSVKVFGASDLTNTVIRPRDFDALLFGEVVGRSLDLFAFWHSSQRNDPGLNVALYTNVKTDKLLSDVRKDTDQKSREEKISAFVDIIKMEYPAAFLYAPEFIYIVPDDLAGVRLGSLTTSAERFLNVYEWHRETERVWDIFTDSTNVDY